MLLMITHMFLWRNGKCPKILYTKVFVCLFVLRFYGPLNPVGSCRARSVYLTTRLLGRTKVFDNIACANSVDPDQSDQGLHC